MLEISATFEPGDLLTRLETKYGVGSDFQYAASETIFEGISKYVPNTTGYFLENSRRESERLYRDGEIIYTSGNASWKDYARFLHEGLLMLDTVTHSAFSPRGGTKYVTSIPLNFKNPMAVAFWDEVAESNDYDKWIAELQKRVDLNEF